jgi:hypothetical protein
MVKKIRNTYNTCNTLFEPHTPLEMAAASEKSTASVPTIEKNVRNDSSNLRAPDGVLGTLQGAYRHGA